MENLELRFDKIIFWSYFPLFAISFALRSLSQKDVAAIGASLDLVSKQNDFLKQEYSKDNFEKS